MQEQTLSDSRARVLEMFDKGLTPRTIALDLGISTQKVYVHLKALRKAGLIPEKEAS